MPGKVVPAAEEGTQITAWTPGDDDLRRRVLAFRAATWPGVGIATEAFFQWAYEACPVGDSARRLWLVTRGEEVLGEFGTLPAPLMIDGRRHDAAWGLEIFLDRSLRGKGLGLELTCTAQTRFEAMMSFEVSEAAQKTFHRAGWFDLGTVPLWARPLDPEAIVRERANLPMLAPLARQAGRIMGAGDEMVARLADRLVDVREVARFDEGMELVCRSASYRYPVIVRRDVPWLNWRYADHPETGRYRLLAFSHRGVPVGYAVLRMGRAHGVSAGYIVDFLAEPGWLLPVLAHAVETLRRSGAAMAYAIHLGPDMERLRWLGFLRRDTGWKVMYRPQDLDWPSRARLARRGSWYLTGGDSNVDRPRSASPPAAAVRD